MSKEKNKIRYIHRNPNQEATTPGVQFQAFNEVCLDVDEKKVFYTTEVEVVDMSCCGTAIRQFVTVYGYVDQWKSLRTEQGDFITFAEPIRDESAQKEISRVIKQKEMMDQINFK